MLLHLASQSPRRRELLTQIGVDFQVLSVTVDESPLPGEKPAQLVQRLARNKAAAGLAALAAKAKDADDDPPILGADTIVVVDDTILGKPKDETDAKAMLIRLSNRRHQVFSAVSLCNRNRQMTELSITEVHFRAIELSELDRYCASGEPLGKAGAYAIQGLAGLFVTRLEGSYSGVVGLPLEKLFPLLRAFGVPYWRKQTEQ